ncbi:unnamed protein product, partial [Mycena citricolor]
MSSHEDEKFASPADVHDAEKGVTSDEAAALEAAALPEFDDPNLDKDAAIAGVLEDDSPYPEVRSAVANTDDPTVPVSTVRAWTLGLIWAIIIPGLNQFFFFRYPSVTVSSMVAQLLTFPLGRLWARLVPNFRIFGVELNPGPFTIKEHVLITIMAGVGSGSAYATDIIAVQRVFYHQNYNFGYQWLVVMSTQLIGFSIGGIARRFLVQPPSMIWPYNLVTCALFNTLHAQQYAGVGTRGACRVKSSSTSPGDAVSPGTLSLVRAVCRYLFTALSFFSWVCWIKPNNLVVNQLFGVNNGLAMGLITFDWAQIAYTGSPLATPWWAEANVLGGFLFFFWFLTPILYFTNACPYNVTAILNDQGTFDEAKYQAYSPLYLSTTFALAYGLSFASITATITHAFLFFRKQIWTQARRSMHEQPDIHARLMAVYPQVPEWWYSIILVTMFVAGVVAITVWDTKFPVQYFILALAISFVYVIPIGMIQAITTQQVGLNVITELIIGYSLPGRPVAMMM